MEQRREPMDKIDALVLPGISDEQHTVLRADLLKKIAYLFCTGETRFIIACTRSVVSDLPLACSPA